MGLVKNIIDKDLFRTYIWPKKKQAVNVYKGIISINGKTLFDTGNRDLLPDGRFGMLLCDNEGVHLKYDDCGESNEDYIKDFYEFCIRNFDTDAIVTIEGRALEIIKRMSRLSSSITFYLFNDRTVAKIAYPTQKKGELVAVVEMKNKPEVRWGINRVVGIEPLLFNEANTVSIKIDGSYVNRERNTVNYRIKNVLVMNDRRFGIVTQLYALHNKVSLSLGSIYTADKFIPFEYDGYPLTVTDGEVTVYRELYEPMLEVFGKDNILKVPDKGIVYDDNELIVVASTL